MSSFSCLLNVILNIGLCNNYVLSFHVFFYSPQSIKDGTQSCISTALLSGSNHFNSHYIFLQDLDCDKLDHEGVPAERRKPCCTDPPALFSGEEHKICRVHPKHTLQFQKWESCQAKLLQMTEKLSVAQLENKKIIIHAAFPLESLF